MKKNKSVFVAALLLAMFAYSCNEKTPDTPPATVPERIVALPTNLSLKIGDTATVGVQYFNTIGEEDALPAAPIWSSINTNVATVDAAGLVTALSEGQTEIKAMLNDAMSAVLVTVVANADQIASISIEPLVAEVKLNEKVTFVATARNLNGTPLSGKNFVWQSEMPSVASINATTGEAEALSYGTTNISASAEGIFSSSVMLQVVRQGSFSKQGSSGNVTLKIENNILKLQTAANFKAATSAPDLRIYLSPNPSNVSGGVEITTLSNRSGAQSWNLPMAVSSITQYRYVVIWCKQFSAFYGSADLGS